MRLIAAGVLIVTVWIYAPVANAGFVYEDANWTDQLTNTHPAWHGRWPGRAITQWTYWMQADNGVARPRPYHLVNLWLHLICGLLVGLFARAWGMTRGASLLAMTVFLWHPLNTQAVAYVSGRADLLMTFWTLAAVLVARRSLTGWRHVPQWLVVGACCWCAASSKELGLVAVPLVVLTVGSRVALYAGGALVAVGLPFVAIIVTRPDLAGWVELATGNVMALWRLVALVIVPVGLSIDPDPWWWPLPLRLLGVLLLIGGAVWGLRQSSRVTVWACAWALVVLLPRVLVPTFEAIQEHHAYLAMVPVAIVAGSWVKEPV